MDGWTPQAFDRWLTTEPEWRDDEEDEQDDGEGTPDDYDDGTADARWVANSRRLGLDEGWYWP